MKRCPECRRDYFDDSLIYCLDDGNALLEGPASGASTEDEPRTAILHDTDLPGEASARAQINTTERTAILPSGSSEVPKTRSLDKRLLLAPLVLAVMVLGGLAGYRYLSTAEADQISSIAVLPFENRSGSSDADYLSEGLTDSLVYRLSQLPELKVSPTSSVMQYKGKEAEIAQVAQELGVDAVMSGRLVQRGEDLMISLQLIDARTEKVIWAEQYDRKMSALMATQREIATVITQKLQLKLAGDEKGITKKYTESNEAYQLYLRGNYHLGRRTREDLLRGIDYFRQAINVDPNFALAHARIAETFNQMPAYGYLSPKEAAPQAKAAALKALEVDPALAEGHAALGNAIAVYEWKWAEAEQEFKRALELDPNSSATYLRYAQVCLSPQGRSDEAIAAIKRALEIEPLNISTGAISTSVYFQARQFDKAIEQARTYYELEPNHVSAQFFLAEAYNEKGMFDEAIKIGENFIDSDPSSQLMLQSLGYAYAKTGQTEKARQVISQFDEIAKTNYVAPFMIAIIYVGLGDKDRAFSELERSYAERDWHYQRLKTEPMVDPLRDDPRFEVILKRLGLSE